MLEGGVDVSGETVVPLLCGGNLDMTMLEEVIDHVLVSRQRLVRLRVRIDDQPGTMHEISKAIGDEGANIRTVQHRRAMEDLNVGEAFLEFRIETGGADQTRRVIEAIEAVDYPVERLP
jgi:threonine dehydratase